jgi:hypothetical protein
MNRSPFKPIIQGGASRVGPANKTDKNRRFLRDRVLSA